MKPKSNIFLTGATGLVGSYLLNLLLQDGHKVYALARRKNNKNATDRVLDCLKLWNNQNRFRTRNLFVVEGDITDKDLGIINKAKDSIANEINEIFHCAACVDFNINWRDSKRINVDGTRNVLDFALSCNKLNKVNYISTAFVCGDHKGVFREKDLLNSSIVSSGLALM